METKNEIVINDTIEKQHSDEKPKKIKKPMTEAQKERQREYMKKFYLKNKDDPDYKERQRRSSKTHYNNHKDKVLERIRAYHKNRLELAQIEMLYELQQERLEDLNAGDITQEEFNKLQYKINNKLAHLHLVS